MAFAAATDLFTMTVPNRLALALVACFFVLAPMVGLGWTDIGLHVALALAALAVTFVLFSFGWIGGGDAKLFAATCLWLGPKRSSPTRSTPRCSAARSPSCSCSGAGCRCR